MFDQRPADAAPEESAPGFFGRLRARLNRGGASLARELRGLLQGRQISAELLEELEARLIGADLGVRVTHEILEDSARPGRPPRACGRRGAAGGAAPAAHGDPQALRSAACRSIATRGRT